MPDRAQPCWYDGRCYEDGRFSIAASDPGLLFGATVFSTLRVYNGNLDDPRTAWPAHCQRLAGSIAAFGWTEPDWSRVEAGGRELAGRYPVVRVTLFPDGRELVTGRALPPDLAQKQRDGVTAWVAPPDRYDRSLARHKTGNYLGAWSALGAARSRGCGEAILTDGAGRWLETSTGNLWGIRDRVWHTPPIDGSILPGIMRGRMLAGLRSRRIAVDDVTQWTAELRSGFEVLAYSNCVVECVPIRAVCDSAGAVVWRSADEGWELLRGLANGSVK